jgi:hypothetical protein
MRMEDGKHDPTTLHYGLQADTLTEPLDQEGDNKPPKENKQFSFPSWQGKGQLSTGRLLTQFISNQWLRQYYEQQMTDDMTILF